MVAREPKVPPKRGCASGAFWYLSATSRLGVSRTHSRGRAAGPGMSGFITSVRWTKA